MEVKPPIKIKPYTMSEIDELYNSIIEFETDNKNISSWGARGTITQTATIKKLITIDEHLASKTVKPDKISKIFVGIFLLFGPVMAIIEIIKNRSNSMGVYVIIPLFFVFLFLGFIIEQSNKRINYTITLSREGIACDKIHYKWSDIKGTAYLHLPIGKKGQMFLVLLFNNNEYDTWELTEFRSFYPSFTTKLANYIEHFKPTS